MLIRDKRLTTDVERVEAVSVPVLMAEASGTHVRAIRVNGNVDKDDALLHDGDVLAVDCRPDITDGEIALLDGDDGLVLRRIYWETDGVRLEPLDPRCAATRAQSLAHLDVQGRVVAIVRRVHDQT